MSVYFTNNQYLKTAEEDFEAAELLYGHNYYDQIGTLLSVSMTKYLKAIIESIVPNDESTAFFITEDKIELLRKYARECDKEGLSGGRYFLANLFKKDSGKE